MRDYASLYSSLLADLELEGISDFSVYSDMDAGGAARATLAGCFLKKLCPSGTSASADAAALVKFESINARLPECGYEFPCENEAESCFWDYFQYHLNVAVEPHESIGSFDVDSIREGMGVGPGAAQKADASSMVTKLFNGEMSTTNYDLIPYYRAALVETGFWADAERQRFETYGFTKVRGGKLFFAPKNAEISRTCCTEASLNMLIQKAIGTFLEFRLGWYYGISLSHQPDNNRKLACIGSVDGSFGTIDSISASDSIGLQLLKRALRPSFLKTMIMASRSETAVLPDGREVALRMISTMGNGFTFPLQTVIFASAVRAVYQLMGFPCDCPKTQYGVFGDDIIVRREAYEFLIRMLAKLGFQVNVGKSFNSGAFRESCGHDYYRGINIRGVYVTSLEIPQHVYSAINRLTRWSALHGVPLPRTLSLLYSWIQDIRIPLSEADDAGIKAPFKLTKPRVDNSYWFKYRCYKRRVKRMKVVEPDDDSKPFNPDGIAVGFLSGAYRRRDVVLDNPESSAWQQDWDASYTIRERVGARPRYQVITKSIPFWDYIPDHSGFVSGVDDPITRTRAHNPVDSWCQPITRLSHDAWVSVMVDFLPSWWEGRA